MDAAPVPANCVSLSDAFERSAPYQVIGVCVDFLPATKSNGSDYAIKFKLRDQTWKPWTNGHNLGMPFRCFYKEEKALPAIENQGDVVILRNFSTRSIHGEKLGFSNSYSGSKWVVLPFEALETCTSVSDMRSKARWSGQHNSFYAQPANLFTEEELRYARYLAQHEDQGSWRPLTASTALQRAHIKISSGGNPLPADMNKRFRLIKDLEAPNPHYFVELLGEVRKIFWKYHDRPELQLTDYTSNPHLFNYRYDHTEDGAADDPHKWPGPWGRMNLTVTLWDSHGAYVRDNDVGPGTFLCLRNVQIKMDNAGTRLEGKCRGDPTVPTRVNVQVVKPSSATHDERMKALLSRKREYEAKAKTENIRFLRNAQPGPKRLNDGDGTDEPKGKKARMKNRKKKERAKAEARQRSEQILGPESKRFVNEPNPNVRCEKVDVPCKTVADILDPELLVRKTPKGTPFSLPFQNCKYKANVRVVDFFPDNIADFAVPRKISQYDYLSGADDSADSDTDLTQDNGDGVSWEWRFFLLVEDARLPVVGGKEPARMELLVAKEDGDYLLDMEACNLRDKSNAKELAMVKEKLFHLWGDLQEKKAETATAEASAIKPNARPFQCHIKEYGVPTRSMVGRPKDSLSYERIFRMFGTRIF
ncbi:hypothetical protein ABEF95_010803 [Exophiala dermatitidis]